MTEKSLSQFDLLVEQYLGLKSLEITEALLTLCGATLDGRALPLLRRRLREEREQVPLLEARGYLRMREKCEQLIASLIPLIAFLEEEASHDTASETQH